MVREAFSNNAAGNIVINKSNNYFGINHNGWNVIITGCASSKNIELVSIDQHHWALFLPTIRTTNLNRCFAYLALINDTLLRKQTEDT